MQKSSSREEHAYHALSDAHAGGQGLSADEGNLSPFPGPRQRRRTGRSLSLNRHGHGTAFPHCLCNPCVLRPYSRLQLFLYPWGPRALHAEARG